MTSLTPRATLPLSMLAILAVTQVVSWGSIIYSFAILSAEIQRELGLSAEIVFGGYSLSLLVAGVLATPVGAMLDRIGGRNVMGAGSLLAACGLTLLGLAQSAPLYWLACAVIGISMAMVLYEAAFATVNRESPVGARRSISILTLFGGFASTLFWPLTLKLSTLVGWRDTYLIYAALQLLLCAPLHALLPARAPSVSNYPHAKGSLTLVEAIRHPVFWRLATAFAANSFVFSALTVHLIPLLHKMGHALGTAVMLAALIGPMQVAGRLGEMVFARQARPKAVGKLIFAVLPLSLTVLLLVGSQEWAAASFCLLYGLSNGIMTIVRGTLPADLFGTENYGAISGALAGPSLVFKAAGPFFIAWVIGTYPSASTTLTILMIMSTIALAFYLTAIHAQPRQMRYPAGSASQNMK
jgi:MFS family permease